jgi:hypothetical protein
MAPTSISTMATILTDEIDNAVPRNNAVTRSEPDAGTTPLGKA